MVSVEIVITQTHSASPSYIRQRKKFEIKSETSWVCRRVLARLNLKVHARAPRIDLQKRENYVGKFHQKFEGRKSNWEKDGLNNFMTCYFYGYA